MRFNVLSCYNAPTNDLPATARVDRLDAAHVIDTLDAWAATRSRPTVLVPDNARIPPRGGLPGPPGGMERPRPAPYLTAY
ncbi:hypothetical protein [Hymenobacter nivis]|uniref:hypothetical protein n=1 Tax=Hymenobacter nivis TaxID=1850093 RepID=UPI0013A5A27D|nr:hypothetical protein [Hymenobacter nivis]